jgi:hypothetical protein
LQTKNPGKRKGRPATGRPFLFQGRIVPTELKNPSKLSGENLMGRKSEVSSNFYDLKAFIINNLTHRATMDRIAPF